MLRLPQFRVRMTLPVHTVLQPNSLSIHRSHHLNHTTPPMRPAIRAAPGHFIFGPQGCPYGERTFWRFSASTSGDKPQLRERITSRGPTS